MAKITLSDAAPAEAVHFTFAEDEFDLGGSGKKSYETDHVGTISEANTHPWLNVSYAAVDVVGGDFRDQVAPEDDPLSGVGSLANDPAAVRAAQAADVETTSVAIEAGKDQTVPVVTDGVAETLAADPTSKTADKVDDTKKDS